MTKLHSTSGNAISRLGSLHESALKREYPRELSSPLSSHVPHRLRAGTCVNACFYCRASRPSKLRNGSRCRHSAKATPVHNEHRIDPKAPNVVRSCILPPFVCLNVCLTFQPSCTCCGCKLRCRMTTICSSKTIAGLRRFPGAKIPRSPKRFRFRLRTWREAGSQSRQDQEGSTHRQDAAGNRPCFLRPSDRLLSSRNKAIIAIGKNVASILCQNNSKANRENSPESRLAAAAVHCVRVSGFGCLRERGRGNVAHRRAEDRHLHLAA